MFEKGELFHDLAQDYFVVTGGDTLDWSRDVPPFVIGRRGYDNWMVAYVHKHPNITLLDGTQTMRVIHQTDEDGNNMAHGGTMKQSVADADYHMQFIPRKYLAIPMTPLRRMVLE